MQPHERERLNDLRIAIVCGALPLAFGSGVYWLWRYTRWDSLPGWGIATVLIGIPFFVAGIIHLARFWKNSGQDSGASPKQRGVLAYIAIFLLLVNFPAAAIYAISALNRMDETLVSIENASGQDIDSLVLSGPGVEVEVGPIPDTKSTQVFLDFRGDGLLSFRARQGELDFDGELSGYVTGAIGGEVNATILPNGSFELTEDREFD